jgi:GTP-binding protein
MAKPELARKKAALEKASGAKVYLISGVSGEGVNDVLRAMASEIKKRRNKERRGDAAADAWSP